MSESVSRLATDLGGDLLRASLLGAPRPVLDERYTIHKVLGRGVSGVVVRARDERLARDVAIKLTPASAATERMMKEARALAQLRRPDCVVQVWEATRGRLTSSSQGGELHYIVMELVVGVTLREWQARDRTVVQVLNVYANVAVGLDRVHSAGIAHGDVKPDNVIVDDVGVPTLVDFGFAANVGTQQDSGFFQALSEGLGYVVGGGARGSREVVGTPPYMAPEVRTGDIRRESDVHAYAVSLWEGLTGEVPFNGEQAPTRWLAVTALPGEEHIPKALRKTLKQAMQPEPWGRPSIGEVHAKVVQAEELLSRRPTRWGLWLMILLGLMGVGTLALAALYAAVALGSEPGGRRGATSTPTGGVQAPLPSPSLSHGDLETAACAALPVRWEVSMWATDPDTGRRVTWPNPVAVVLLLRGGCRYAVSIDGESAGEVTLRATDSEELVGTALVTADGGSQSYELRFQGRRIAGNVDIIVGGERARVFSFAGSPVL